MDKEDLQAIGTVILLLLMWFGSAYLIYRIGRTTMKTELHDALVSQLDETCHECFEAGKEKEWKEISKKYDLEPLEYGRY